MYDYDTPFSIMLSIFMNLFIYYLFIFCSNNFAGHAVQCGLCFYSLFPHKCLLTKPCIPAYAAFSYTNITLVLIFNMLDVWVTFRKGLRGLIEPPFDSKFHFHGKFG